MIGGVPNDYLNPNTSLMKMIAWNYQGAGSITFRNHAYELQRRHRPNILIIIEPRIAKAKAQAVINTFPYTHSRHVDPTGFSGGIWMLWNESPSFKVEIITHSEYSIHALVKVSSPSLSFLLTAVYASSNFNKRKIFWDYLQNLVAIVSLPWVLLGDFNDMLSDDEKMGGLPVNRHRITTFRNCMDKYGLMDLGFQGPRFTWTTKSPIWQNIIKEQLDRRLGNVEWKLLFPTAEIHDLPRVKSDHCPILLITNPLEPKSPKPFRFEQMWLTDPTFLSLVEDSWKASTSLPSTSSSLSRFLRHLDFLTDNIRTWNKNHFGHLFQCKNQILARIRGLQLALTRKPSAFLYSLKK